MDEWFIKRKGLAYGIMWSGTGLAGVVLPLFMESLLGSLGFRTTLRLWAGLLFVLTTPLSWFIKPRLPVAATSHVKPFNLKFLMMPTFLLYQVPCGTPFLDTSTFWISKLFNYYQNIITLFIRFLINNKVIYMFF